MKYYFFILMTAFSIHAFSQTDSTKGLFVPAQPENHDKGWGIFLGLGQGGNTKVTGLGSGASLRVHRGIHTLCLNVCGAHHLGYHGEEDDTPTLKSTCAGLGYGIGYYGDAGSISATAGLGYSSVTMSTGGGVNYWSKTYNKAGGCLGVQWGFHGRHFGFGLQGYYNITSEGNDFSFLAGIVFGSF